MRITAHRELVSPAPNAHIDARLGTHPESVRYARAEEAHEVDVFLAGELRLGRGAVILVLKHKIVSDVGRAQPDHL